MLPRSTPARIPRLPNKSLPAQKYVTTGGIGAVVLSQASRAKPCLLGRARAAHGACTCCTDMFFPTLFASFDSSARAHVVQTVTNGCAIKPPTSRCKQVEFLACNGKKTWPLPGGPGMPGGAKHPFTPKTRANLKSWENGLACNDKIN